MGPVFLLAGGGRTGSTLIQRLILSTRQVLMWGEHNGILLPQLRSLLNQTVAWAKAENGYEQLASFKADAHNAWVSNINPELPYFQAGCRAFLQHSLGAAARNMGYPRWGFKEIRYGKEEARTLQAFFPHASFIFLVRNPVSCLRSIKGTGWHKGDPVQFLNTWTQISGELAEVQPKLKRACLIRYEDAIANPQKITETIAEVIQVPVSAFDLSVFDHVIRGSPMPPAQLDTPDLQGMRDGRLLAVAQRLGYSNVGAPDASHI